LTPCGSHKNAQNRQDEDIQVREHHYEHELLQV
jgi:hypothetical protein